MININIQLFYVIMSLYLKTPQVSVSVKSSVAACLVYFAVVYLFCALLGVNISREPESLFSSASHSILSGFQV